MHPDCIVGGGGSLNALLACTMACGSQNMDKSVFCPFHTGLVPINQIAYVGGMEDRLD